MERVVDVGGGVSFYVVYRMKGDEAIIFGIACAVNVILYKNGFPEQFNQHEKVLLDQSTTLRLHPDNTQSLERVLMEALKKVHKISAGKVTTIRQG